MKNLLIDLKNKVPTFFKKEQGATMVEYAIMLALIAIVSIAMIQILGQKVNNTFSTIQSAMPNNG
ncbi:Flp family type IVb pilin [Methylomicrobium lacus]|uniref:Flp family type IVb pilin n=1 Tax=Methylomicrobium lacus TaxID=136992 RepID=UPI0004B4169C|nr:Flp family type IVb pilin [Methylomicrobium lacus]